MSGLFGWNALRARPDAAVIRSIDAACGELTDLATTCSRLTGSSIRTCTQWHSTRTNPEHRVPSPPTAAYRAPAPRSATVSNLCENPFVIGYTRAASATIYAAKCCRTFRPRSPSSTRVCRRSSFSTSRADPNNPFERIMGGAQDNGTLLFDKAGGDGAMQLVRRLRDRRRDLGERIPSDQSRHPVRELPKSIFLHELPPRQRGNRSVGVDIGADRLLGRAGKRVRTVYRTPVHDHRPGAPRHAVHRLCARLAHARQRRQPGFLEANCTAFQVFFLGNFSLSCGDWTALGPSLNDAVSGFGADRAAELWWQHSARPPMPDAFGLRPIWAACS